MDMFSNFTVLFVGYSHEDSVMRYLARGFVNTTARYALTLPGDDSHWRYLGIAPVHFPKRNDPPVYQALPASIKAWSELANMGILDHEARIETIVQGLPPLDPDLADYIEARVRDDVTLQFFTKHAKTAEWLKWADEKKLLDELFDLSASNSDRGRHLAYWFADEFAARESREALTIARRRQRDMSPELWHQIASTLANNDPRPSVALLSSWALILVNSLGVSRNTHSLGALLASCRLPDQANPALVIFGALVRPRAEPAPPFGIVDTVLGTSGRTRISLCGSADQLREVWDSTLRPNIGRLYSSIRPILTTAITEAFLYVEAIGEADKDSDPLSFQRERIEHSDGTSGEWEFLIDAARDLLAWMMTSVLSEAKALVDEWSASDPSLLRRLAIHGRTIQPDLAPDDTLKEIQSKNWLYTFSLKHEVYQLLKRVFPLASIPAQEEFVGYSLAEPMPFDTANEDAAKTAAYERYNVAVWLRQVAPNSTVAEKHLSELQQAAPEFMPREHPDLDHWTSGAFVVTPKSPITVADLLEESASERLDWLLTYNPATTGLGEADREGLLLLVQEIPKHSFAWSMDLAEVLADRSEWDSDLWPNIIDGWRVAELPAGTISEVLAFLEQHSELDVSTSRSISQLLDTIVDLNAGELQLELASRCVALGNRLVSSVDPEPTVVFAGEPDWLTQAINHVGGRVAIVWMKALSKLRLPSGAGLPEQYRVIFANVVLDSAKSRTAQFARVVLASQIQFLFAIDRTWARENLIPLFDWDDDVVRAEQAWHGFAGWGHWDEALFSAMTPQLKQTLARFQTLTAKVRQALCHRLAAAAGYLLVSPWPEGWLRDFVLGASGEDLKLWAASFGRLMESLAAQAAGDLWDRWVADYWSKRLLGIPRPLSEDEKGAMIAWLLPFRGRTDQVVERIMSAATADFDEFIFYQLQQSGLARDHGAAMARVLRHLLEGMQRATIACSYFFDIASTALANGADRADVRNIADSMGRFGCERAKELRQMANDA